MKKYYTILLVAVILAFFSSCQNKTNYNALIITGQGNQNWQASNPVLKELLEQTMLFKADIIISPAKGGDMSSFNPAFTKYDVIVLDYNGDSWSDKTKKAFVEYVSNGGGVVVYNESDNSFPEWDEYNKMIGLGGGNGRNEKSGPFVYYRRNEVFRDTAAGPAGRTGVATEFPVKTRNSEHPITKGLPVNWIHGTDELVGRLRGPAENMEILATAFAVDPMPEQPQGEAPGGRTFARRTGRDEPVLMAINFGKGRIFHTVLGKAEEGGGPAMECAGFIVTFQRGAEWAASGNVTQEVPFDFPSNSGAVMRTGFKVMTLDDALEDIESYDITKSTKSITFIRNYIRKISGDEKALLSLEKMMVDDLKEKETTIDAKKLLIRELSWMGSEYSIPVLKELAAGNELKDEAEFALARLQSAE